MLQQYPLGISIETKRHGGDLAKGEQQLAIWHAAQWEFLRSRAGPSAVDELGFLPGSGTRPLVVTCYHDLESSYNSKCIVYLNVRNVY
jgi:hypothetical protein